MPKTEKKYDKIKAIRVNDEILEKCPKTKKFSTWIKELILNQSGTDDDVFKRGFEELYSIFDEFSKNPTLAKANALFLSADLEIIDKAKEVLIVE